MLSAAAIGHLHSKFGWTPEFCVELFPYYLCTLKAFADGKPAVVLNVVDAMWHAHILSTREYHAFCEEQFGGYLHHEFGADSEGAVSPSSWRDMFSDSGLDPEALVRLCADTRFGSDLLRSTQCSSEEGPPPSFAIAAPNGELLASQCSQKPRPKPMPAPPRIVVDSSPSGPTSADFR